MTKRVLDVCLGTALAILALPVILVAAIGSLIALRASPLFVQERVGRGGQPFRLVKIRTLPTSAPPNACKTAVREIRIPRFAKMLREFHLDELPQLFLVPLGRMSLVGPRPEMPELHALLDLDFAHDRTRARPGCTGLWQIGNSKHDLIGNAPEFDRYYVQNQTLRLDLWIILRSARALLPRARTVGLAEIPRWTGADRSRTSGCLQPT